MKNKKMLAILVALTITVSGVSVNGADFSDGAVGSAQEEETEKMPDKDGNADSEEQGEDSAFQALENDEFSEDEISVFTDEGEDAKAAGNADAAQISDGTGEKENSEEEKGTEGLEYEYLPETDSYRVVKGVNEKLVKIPEKYEGKEVSEIGERAFSGCDQVEKVYMLNYHSSFRIRTFAFENCSSLRGVLFFGGVTVESHAFYNCPKLFDFSTIIWYDNTSTSIADDAFDADSKVLV